LSSKKELYSLQSGKGKGKVLREPGGDGYPEAKVRCGEHIKPPQNSRGGGTLGGKSGHQGERTGCNGEKKAWFDRVP